ncbi:MAG: FtsX-like permease family protein [Marinilabiliaceae bacterium]|jgi:putative ABC transport system permease protein|nr:FtsX-like permease family protein [Marinilabiliaceae bacterium]
MKNINLIIIFRSFSRQKFYKLINIAGLALGMAGSMILLLYVTNELSYNQAHKNIKRIYRVNTDIAAHNMKYASSPYVLGTSLKNDLEDDVIVGRVFNLPQTNIKYRNELIPAEHVYCVDSDVFRIFTLRIISGRTEGLLNDPGEAVVSRSLARKYFGKEYPIGKTLVLENNGDEFLLRISAVIDDVPQNTSFRPEILVSSELGLDQLDKVIYTSSSEPLGREYYRTSWYMYLFFDNYLLLPENYNIAAVEAQLGAYANKNLDKNLGLKFSMQKYSDIYMHSADLAGEYDNGNIRSVLIYSVVSLLLLCTALFNYVLISSSLMQKRYREMSMKRIMGASRKNIIYDIFSESLLYSFVAMVLGLTIAELALPFLSETLFGKEIIINYLQNYQFTLLIILVVIFIAGLSGFFLTYRVLRYNPLDLIFSGPLETDGRLNGTRLISIAQLIISIVLIVCAMGIWSQIRYFGKADIGFSMDNLLTIDFRDNEAKERYETIKQRLLDNPSVVSVSGSMWAPPTRSNMNMNLQKLDDPAVKVNVQGLMVDYDFAGTLGLEIVRGRDIRQNDNVEEGTVLINSKAIGALGLGESPLGQATSFGTVVGVVKDFHIHSFHKVVPPMVIQYVPVGSRTMILKTEPGAGARVEEYIRELWKEFDFEKDVSIKYLKDSLIDLYAEDLRFGRIITIFSFLTAVIAVLGILGMSRLSAEKKTREIGIRKAMGADSSGLVKSGLLNYIFIIAVAATLAFPLGLILLRRWLQNFEFHRNIDPLLFILTFLLVVTVVLVTVISQIIRSANTNPVESLRYE